MPHFFAPFPKIQYDIDKSGNSATITNIMLRFKISEIIKSKAAVYYNYQIKDGEYPDVIASKYYDDPTLDWVILVTNNVMNPLFDWPMSYNGLIQFIREKYGSVATANQTVHHYEKVIRDHSVLSDGTILSEQIVIIDETTYNTTSALIRRSISAYDYETTLNDAKRDIRILDKKHLRFILGQVEGIFNA